MPSPQTRRHIRGMLGQEDRLVSKVAVVTGGTRGIGRAVCEKLKADGMRVAAIYAGNDKAARECRETLEILALKCDVAASW